VGWEHFEPVGRCEIEHEQTLSSEGLVALVGSLSFVGALEPPERERVLGRVGEMLAAQGVDEHELRWRCNVYLTKRR
jgi:hypothetical protein